MKPMPETPTMRSAAPMASSMATWEDEVQTIRLAGPFSTWPSNPAGVSSPSARTSSDIDTESAPCQGLLTVMRRLSEPSAPLMVKPEA